MAFNAYSYRANRDERHALVYMAEARVAKMNGDTAHVVRCVKLARTIWHTALIWREMARAGKRVG